MKIRTLSTNSNKPLVKTQIQLQIKGKDSGYLTVTTDQNGEFALDQKYTGQQLASLTGGQGAWTAIADGATLRVGATTTGTSTSTTGSTTKSKERSTSSK
jgi:hypothetical protein